MTDAQALRLAAKHLRWAASVVHKVKRYHEQGGTPCICAKSINDEADRLTREAKRKGKLAD